MANSKFEYVRSFERDEILLPSVWIVVRLDGRGFHRLSHHYGFTKPNDIRALNLMNEAAKCVMSAIPELCVGYGVSDEYSFVFEKSTNLFDRRAAKLVSAVVSTFTAFYVHLWTQFFGDRPLDATLLPTFDGRAICYPGSNFLRDYLSWRQVDCHINNLYNTTFWAMVQKGRLTTTAAEDALKGTVAADKNEILFSRFGINYNNELDIFRKGSVVFRDYGSVEPSQTFTYDVAEEDQGTGVPVEVTRPQFEKIRKAKAKATVTVQHLDIIKDDFWTERPWILGRRPTNT